MCVSMLRGGGSVRDTQSEVRDALEDLVKETVGAMELTEDYYTHTETAVIHMLTHS